MLKMIPLDYAALVSTLELEEAMSLPPAAFLDLLRGKGLAVVPIVPSATMVRRMTEVPSTDRHNLEVWAAALNASPFNKPRPGHVEITKAAAAGGAAHPEDLALRIGDALRAAGYRLVKETEK